MLILLTETKHFPLTFCFVMSVGKKLFSTKFREGKKEKIYIHIKGGIMIYHGIHKWSEYKKRKLGFNFTCWEVPIYSSN